jgi:hypothetical protein
MGVQYLRKIGDVSDSPDAAQAIPATGPNSQP